MRRHDLNPANRVVRGVARISQWAEGVGGVLGLTPHAAGALDDFCNFSIKITHFDVYFGQNSYLNKAIPVTHQLKAFEKQSKRTK